MAPVQCVEGDARDWYGSYMGRASSGLRWGWVQGSLPGGEKD